MEKNHSLFLSVFLCLKSLSYLIYFIFIAIAIAFFAAVFIASKRKQPIKSHIGHFFFFICGKNYNNFLNSNFALLLEM